MKMIKITIIVTLVILSIISLTLVGFLIYHQVNLKREANQYQPIGEMIEINNKEMHVYVKGEGQHTFVFMSGHGTSSPIFDFKPLWSQLANDHKIIVIEKFGYGFSEVTNQDKDIDIILENTRAAISYLEIEGPFVLVPHSLSGLEAIYWAQKYPDEIKAIIGLDLCVPQAIQLLDVPSQGQLNIVNFISRIGLSRLMPVEQLNMTLPLLNSSHLNDEERAIYEYMFYKSALTKDMLAELKSMKSNAEHLMKLEKPTETPMYLFISNEQNEVVKGWSEVQLDFLNAISNQKSLLLDTGHYVHHEMYTLITTEIINFLDNV
jgi:pimeloyl-ACP methyl ester carboxylesterase